MKTLALDEFKSGWPLLFAALVGCGLGVSSLPLYTAGVFFNALQRDIGWSRAELSMSVLLFTISLAIASPFVGQCIDKYGTQKSIFFSAVTASACYLLMALFLSTLFEFYLYHILIALLGAAAAPIAYTRNITIHFVQARGLALGFTLLGPSIVATIAPSIMVNIIDQAGWRWGYITIGLATISVLGLLVLLKPKPPSKQDKLAESFKPEPHAQERRIFFTLLAALGVFSLGIGGLIVHIVPMITDSGLSSAKAAQVAGLLGISGIAGRLIGGFLADRLFAPHILVALSLIAAAGCLLLALAGMSTAHISAIAIGFSLGAEADLMGYLVARYFPAEKYGRIFGWQYAVFIVGIGLSPVLFGYMHDNFNQYTEALYFSVITLSAASFLFYRLPKFQTS